MKRKLLIFAIVLGSFWSDSVGAVPILLKPGEIGSGKMYLPCLFDGNKDTCFFDTGGSFTNIKLDRFSKKYPSIGKRPRTSAAGIPVECDMIRVGKLTVPGEISIDRVAISRCPVMRDNSNQSEIGMDLFQGMKLFFDFDKNEFQVVEENPLETRPKQMSVEKSYHFSIPVETRSGENYALFDTGAGLSVVDQKYLERNPDLFEFVQDIENGKDATGNPVKMTLNKMMYLKVGELEFRDFYILGLDFTPFKKALPYSDFIIGYNLATSANWFFDFNNQTWANQKLKE